MPISHLAFRDKVKNLIKHFSPVAPYISREKSRFRFCNGRENAMIALRTVKIFTCTFNFRNIFAQIYLPQSPSKIAKATVFFWAISHVI